MSDEVARRGRWVLASAAAAGVAVAGVALLRARRNQGQPETPADVGFMRALHAALRRDLSRLRQVTGQLDGSPAPPTVLAGWAEFQAQLENHDSAEDDDLWPELRGKLSDPGELASVDAMVEEHRLIPSALGSVDAALRGDGDLALAVASLSELLVEHLAHEERDVLPLIEQHMTGAQWRAFLRKERTRRTSRERPDFLAWVLDSASDRDAVAVLTELPAPVRLVYRRILQPRYEAQHRWQLPQAGA